MIPGILQLAWDSGCLSSHRVDWVGNHITLADNFSNDSGNFVITWSNTMPSFCASHGTNEKAPSLAVLHQILLISTGRQVCDG